jgi:hypothetical protein
MSASDMALEPSPAADGMRPPSTTFAETMAKLRFPSRLRVLRDYLQNVDAAVSEAEARAWGESAVMINAREHLRHEARWLREAGPLTIDQRWALLSELASRLHDLSHRLCAAVVPVCLYSTLTTLAATIDADGDIDRVWNEALAVLDDFAAEAPK